MDVIESKNNIDLQYATTRYKQYIDIINYKLKNHQKPHNRRWRQGFFIPKHPLKWINIMETSEPQPIVYRSGWEQKFDEWMDNTSSIFRCGAEVIRILYKDPIKNKKSID